MIKCIMMIMTVMTIAIIYNINYTYDDVYNHGDPDSDMTVTKTLTTIIMFTIMMILMALVTWP